MSRSRYSYSTSRRAPYTAARQPSYVPYRDLLTPIGKRLVAGRHSLNRAALTEPADIARHMAMDLCELGAPDAPVTIADLTARGWTAGQIASHGEAARTRAQADAVRGAR